MPRSSPSDTRYEVEEKHIDFGFNDLKGRRIGALLYTSQIDLVEYDNTPTESGIVHYPIPMEPGHYYTFQAQHTRNGKPYGVSTPRKIFARPQHLDFAARKYLDDAISRARTNNTREGIESMSQRRHEKYQRRPAQEAKKVARLTKQQNKESEAAAKIPIVEAEIQVLLDNAGFMEYLKSHPWPHVIPGPPSMSLTAYDHIVEYSAKQIDHICKYKNHDNPKEVHLGVLKNMLQMLKEQVRRFAKGLPPESATFIKFFGR